MERLDRPKEKLDVEALTKAALADIAAGKTFRWIHLCNLLSLEKNQTQVGPYREFLHVLFHDEDVIDELLEGDVRAKFLVMAESLAMRWGDEFVGEIVLDQGD